MLPRSSFTEDDFDSTFDDSEDALNEHEVAVPHHQAPDYSMSHLYNPGNNYGTPRRSGHRVSGGGGGIGVGGGHSSQHRQSSYGHHVTEVSENYGGQNQAGAGPQNAEFGVYGSSGGGHIEHGRATTNGTDGKSSKHHLHNERPLSYHAHLNHHKSRHDVQRQEHHRESPMSSRAYHATQWRDNQAWQPVSYDYGRTSGTPPTRDLDVMPATHDPHHHQHQQQQPRLSEDRTAEPQHGPVTSPYNQDNVSYSYSQQLTGGHSNAGIAHTQSPGMFPNSAPD